MRIDALTASATQALADAHISETPQLDAQLLLCFVLDKPRTYLYTWPEKNLDAATLSRFETLLTRRLQGEPIAHLTGEREFWSLTLEVNPSTLIPRPDTEALIEHILGLSLPEAAQVVDLGTGTGAIALALASEMPRWQMHAVDLQQPAVELACRNRDRHGLRVDIRQSSWFEALSGLKFDLIVSNPPYIEADDPHLSQGDVRFEPLSALVADNNGLADIEHIIEKGRDFLNDGGTMVLEHGFEQAGAVRQLFEQYGYQQVGSGKDLAGKDRFSFGRLG